MKISLETFIFAARSDLPFISFTLPRLLKMCEKVDCNINVICDQYEPSGLLSKTIKQGEIEKLHCTLKQIQSKLEFSLITKNLSNEEIRKLNKIHFGNYYKESHCFRGYPITGSIRQFHDTDSDYILHLDCDMIFHETLGFSWIKEGIRIMEENEDILCVLPRGGSSY